MIPFKLLEKMGIYENIQISGSTFKVRLVDHSDVVATGLSEIMSEMGNPAMVGLVLRGMGCSIRIPDAPPPLMLQICAGSRCLAVQLRFLDAVPQCLRDFLANPEILFVGVGMDRALEMLRTGYGLEFTSGVEVGELVARVLKKPWAAAVGDGYWTVDVNQDFDSDDGGRRGMVISKVADMAELGKPLGQVGSVNWDARFFSEEEMSWAVQDVCACYLIGKKMLDSL